MPVCINLSPCAATPRIRSSSEALGVDDVVVPELPCDELSLGTALGAGSSCVVLESVYQGREAAVKLFYRQPREDPFQAAYHEGTMYEVGFARLESLTRCAVAIKL